MDQANERYRGRIEKNALQCDKVNQRYQQTQALISSITLSERTELYCSCDL